MSMKKTIRTTELIKRADAGDPEAMRTATHRLLYEHMEKELSPVDAKRCEVWLTKLAEGGDADAMLDLGGMYLVGRGVGKDRDLAFEWYQKSAEAGFPLAYNRLARFYLYDDDTEGLGYLPPTTDPERIAKAHDCFVRGAEKGETGCMVELGIAYMMGECCERDPKTAFDWFKRAYEAPEVSGADKAQAAYSLAKCFRGGEGTERDPETAKRFAEEAVSLERREYDEGRQESRFFIERAEAELRGIIEDLKNG